MTAPGGKNACGVYTPHEVLELKYDRKGWRGCALAEIRLVRTGQGWRSATAYQFMSGDHRGESSPLMDCDPPFPSRDMAIEHGIAQLREAIDGRSSVDANKIAHWLETLRPVQADLFALL